MRDPEEVTFVLTSLLHEAFEVGRPVSGVRDIAMRGQAAVAAVKDTGIARRHTELFNMAIDQFAHDLVPLLRMKK